MFVPPTWFEGLMFQIMVVLVIPLLIALGIGIGTYIFYKNGYGNRDGGAAFAIAFIILIIAIPCAGVANSFIWHDTFEKPSVQEKIITVQEWQPKPGIGTNSNGMMTIDNADELMLITTEKEGFFNNENFFFNKFDTRDIFNKLKVGGTYKIKYYGWREGFNSGFPTILSVEEVIDESNATENKYGDYFGTKLA